jgi:hypothetical protein
VSGDCTFLLGVLSDGNEHSHPEILARSFGERGHGLTVHSRIAELRALGHNVLPARIEVVDGRKVSFYRLASPGERTRDVSVAGPEDVLLRSPGDAEPTAACGPDSRLQTLGDGSSASPQPEQLALLEPERSRELFAA